MSHTPLLVATVVTTGWLVLSAACGAGSSTSARFLAESQQVVKADHPPEAAKMTALKDRAEAAEAAYKRKVKDLTEEAKAARNRAVAEAEVAKREAQRRVSDLAKRHDEALAKTETRGRNAWIEVGHTGLALRSAEETMERDYLLKIGAATAKYMAMMDDIKSMAKPAAEKTADEKGLEKDLALTPQKQEKVLQGQP